MTNLKDPRIRRNTYYVYGVLCQDQEDSPLYVKFGKSYNLRSRLSAIRHSTPLPTRYFTFIEVNDDQVQGDLEKALHRRFAERRVQGEWFRFDPSSPEDKREFNEGCLEMFILHVGVGSKWQKVSSKSLFGADETRPGSTVTTIDRKIAKSNYHFDRLDRYRSGLHR